MTKMPDRHQHQSAATAQATAAVSAGHNKRPSGEPLTGREQENPRKRARSTSPLTSMHHNHTSSSTRISSTSPLLSTAAAAASSAATMVVTADVPTPSAAATGNLPHPPVHRDGHWKSVSQGILRVTLFAFHNPKKLRYIKKSKLLTQNCK